MLSSLSIQNYALIDELSIDFSSGLSIITGETGAGKSILLGALGLVLGNRADSTTLKDMSKKCIVETQLLIKDYGLKTFFEEVDLDYEDHTIIRREILPSGKSRAFVNDTPVTLSVLSELRSKLIDIHSQHQTLQLSDNDFQLEVIDALAKNQTRVHQYKIELKKYNTLQSELSSLVNKQREANQQYDYNLHLYEELNAANIEADEQEALEEKLDKVNNVEEIKASLAEALQITSNEDIGVQNLLYILEQKLTKIAGYSKEYRELSDRISSVKIELDDIVSELEHANEAVDFDPYEAEQLNDRLQLLYSLQKKHYVNSNIELIRILEELSEKVAQVEGGEEIILAKEQEIQKIQQHIDRIAKEISDARKKELPKLISTLESLLGDLGMQHARFSIEVEMSNEYFANGKDRLSFLFSANKGGSFGALKKVASGGELSRIMLAIKKVLSEHTKLPTIIFDEIDTGVSGEISNKMAHIMQQMSRQMQVITITHLPQIAAKGSQHYKVFKEEVNGTTTTRLKQLSSDERIVEIAEMLSGKNISDSAITHAKELLN
ncbi:DNA repair protein RecN [Flavobacteriaceae bacterium S356]|uniref:DNA repair protein RecN n=1 Tax=Asprobacillus argus TaxID=3076534 RepID=A0ABU3LH41_9FLAO|nr:DNA repair protein RecN [Flavobacteriaceae bacterium S356]